MQRGQIGASGRQRRLSDQSQNRSFHHEMLTDPYTCAGGPPEPEVRPF
jgi:hypothetical protein